MREITALNRISKIVDNINYKSVYIEIETSNEKYTIEKTQQKKIGFDTNKVEQNTIK